MTAKEFETTLRELHTRKPFLPFSVEYNDGRRFLVDAPYVAFSGGGAGFMGPDGDFHFFDYTNVGVTQLKQLRHRTGRNLAG